ncbi:MAG: hypothetical protein JJT94_00385 [Bernardetiaceae bacterium]|nr:hypothetical protein [Bernardetiaceae bacterium]
MKFFTYCLLLIMLLCATLSLQAQQAQIDKMEQLAKQNKYSDATKQALMIANNYARNVRTYNEATIYYKKALDFASQANDRRLLATVYFETGQYYARRGMWKDADQNLIAAYNQYRAVGDKKEQARVYRAAAAIYLANNRNATAIDLLEKSASTYKDVREYNNVIDIYEQLAKIYTNLNNTSKAQFYQNQARQLAAPARQVAKIQKQEEGITIDSLNMTREELEREKRRLALLENEKSKQEMMLDSMLAAGEDQAARMREAEARAEFAQLQAEQRQKMLLIVGAAGAVALLFLIFAIIAFIGKRKANKVLEYKNKQIEEQKLLIEKEKAQTDKVLLNILPKEVAEELKEKKMVTPRAYDMVSVIFTDFKGFTNIAEKLSPEEIVRELDTCFTEFDRICGEYNLEKIKTIGDAYMCAGGLPVPNTTNPYDAVAAGLAMQEWMEDMKRKKEMLGEIFFELRLGIHTGKVVAGVVGDKKYAYDIWGDAVNLAARMEQSGEIGKVNISGDTYDLVKDRFFCTHRGKIKAKNKGEVDMYFVERPYA